MLSKVTQWITDPIKFRKLNGWLVIFWIAMLPVSVITGLTTSVAYIVFLSLYACIVGHLGAWAASRSEAQAAILVEEADIDVNIE
jgi:hypothetical protein